MRPSRRLHLRMIAALGFCLTLLFAVILIRVSAQSGCSNPPTSPYGTRTAWAQNSIVAVNVDSNSHLPKLNSIIV